MRCCFAAALAALVSSAAACGGAPLLAGAPQPNPAVVAGIAAAAATAATVADPAGAARLQEAKAAKDRETPPGKREVMPPELLDRLNEADARAGEAAAPPAAPKPNGKTP